MISRAAQTTAVPLSLHHISNWPLQNEGGCEACHYVQEYSQGRETCMQNRLQASRLTLRSTVPVTFSCHLGFSCVSLIALPGEEYVFTFGPYLPDDASAAIEEEVKRAVSLFLDTARPDDKLPFALNDIRRAPAGSVVAAAEWLVEGIADLYERYEWEDQEAPKTQPEERVPEQHIKKKSVFEKRGEEIRLQIAATYLLFGQRAVVRAVLEDCLEEMDDYPRTQPGCLIESISRILDHARFCGGEVDSCVQRFPDFVASIQGLEDRRALLRHASWFFKRISSAKMEEKYGSEFSTMLDRLYNHHVEDLELRDFARQSNLQPATLTRRIEKMTGVKFAELLGRIRVIHAQRLLRRTRLSAAQIAPHVGIRDQSNFTKLFKRYTGITPGRYQQKYNRDK
jgi:AraC-like DNA-binding protein